MKFLKYLAFIIVALIILFALGPKAKFSPVNMLDTDINVSLDSLDEYIAAIESKVSLLKEDNQARIIWANDSLKTKTEYSVVYLHGFSASQEEGDPVHVDFAKRYGFNLYLSRLEDHGRSDTSSFINLTPDNYIQSAEDAIDIAKLLGDKVIVMSCSTGGTLSAMLAAEGENIHSMIMYSPNIDIFDPKSALLLYPWGKQLSSFVLGGEYNRIIYTPEQAKYWNSIYHTNALFAMKSMINEYMTQENFAKIKIPTFIGYYYKDEEHQDNVVSVKRMHDFFNQISTPDDKKRMIAFPAPGRHVICSHVMTDQYGEVENETYKFAEEVLKLTPNIQK